MRFTAFMLSPGLAEWPARRRQLWKGCQCVLSACVVWALAAPFARAADEPLFTSPASSAELRRQQHAARQQSRTDQAHEGELRVQARPDRPRWHRLQLCDPTLPSPAQPTCPPPATSSSSSSGGLAATHCWLSVVPMRPLLLKQRRRRSCGSCGPASSSRPSSSTHRRLEGGSSTAGPSLRPQTKPPASRQLEGAAATQPGRASFPTQQGSGSATRWQLLPV